MGELKIVLREAVLEKFRKKAMVSFGYSKGSLSMAAEKAIESWLKSETSSESFSDSLNRAAGIWKEKTSGYDFVRDIRKDSDKRLKRLGL